MGAWINEYNQGQYDRSNPDQRQFSTTILYDRAIPYGTLDTSDWVVTEKSYIKENADGNDYIGTQSGTIDAVEQ